MTRRTPGVAQKTTKIKKINNYRTKAEREEVKSFCKKLQQAKMTDSSKINESKINQCIKEQRMLSFLPALGVEVLPSCEGICNTGLLILDDNFANMTAMYHRLDLTIQPKQARGSWQCRVATDTFTNEVRTLVFFDSFDEQYTPAAISLTPYEPDLKYKTSDYEKFLEPLKVQCVVDGLTESDVGNFEKSYDKSKADGDMTGETGKYPDLKWSHNGEKFNPGRGHMIYGGHYDMEYLKNLQIYFKDFDKHDMLRWDEKNHLDSAAQNVFDVYRNGQAVYSKIRMASTLKIYDWIRNDSGMYKCGMDYAFASYDAKPFSAPVDNLYTVKKFIWSFWDIKSSKQELA